MGLLETHTFSLAIPQEVLDDLKERLARSRWPDEATGADWDYGSKLAYMRELVDYWRTGFDWRAQERAINHFAHYRAEVDGLGIHFIHERGRGPHPLPLILTHGWPSTFMEISKLIPLLTNPASFGGDLEDAFDVVVPSLPGFGFSDRPSKPGYWQVHEQWASLMAGLGYERFGAQGGDIGAGVTTNLGRFFPERLVGIHFSSNLTWPSQPPDPSELSAAEKDYIVRVERWEREEGAYEHEQRTKPQTLAYGLNDSPIGLAAWIVEKLRAWSDCDGDVERRFSKDDMLTTIMIYWATQTISSSVRCYYDWGHAPMSDQKRKHIDVPTGVAVFPGEYLVGQVPREWAERSYNVTHWTQMPRGGHFAAWEEPELLAEDIKAFFRPLRTSQ